MRWRSNGVAWRSTNGNGSRVGLRLSWARFGFHWDGCRAGLLLTRSAVKVDSMNSNVAFLVRRVLRELAGHGSRTTALRVVDRVHLASLETLCVRASLGAPLVLVNELYIRVFVTRNLHVVDRGLLLRDLAAA